MQEAVALLGPGGQALGILSAGRTKVLAMAQGVVMRIGGGEGGCGRADGRRGRYRGGAMAKDGDHRGGSDEPGGGEPKGEGGVHVGLTSKRG